MKRFVIALLLMILPTQCPRAQVCYGGLCYPQQPSAAARLVMPFEPANQFPHDAHCRIFVGDGSVGSGTLIARHDTTGLVLTCFHLFDDAASNVVIAFADGSRYGANLIDRDPAHDLAALLIKRPKAEPGAVNH